MCLPGCKNTYLLPLGKILRPMKKKHNFMARKKVHMGRCSTLLVLFLLFSLPATAQRILLVEKPGTFKNYKYFTGDMITLRISGQEGRLSGSISVISDSSLLIDDGQEVMLADIDRVLRPRWGLGVLAGASRIAGVAYLSLDVVNHAINDEPDILDRNTVLISAGLVAFSYALYPLRYKRMTIGEPWRIQVLDMSWEGEALNPFQR